MGDDWLLIFTLRKEMFRIWSDGQKTKEPKNNDDDGYDDVDNELVMIGS